MCWVLLAHGAWESEETMREVFGILNTFLKLFTKDETGDDETNCNGVSNISQLWSLRHIPGVFADAPGLHTNISGCMLYAWL